MSVFDDPYLNSKVSRHELMGDDSEQVVDLRHPLCDSFIGIDVSCDLKKSEKYKLLKAKEVRHTVKSSYSGYEFFTSDHIKKTLNILNMKESEYLNEN